MHSRIIELGNAPILPDDRMGECSVPEWFYHSIADYTNAETDRDEDLKWFLEIVAHIVDVAEDGESFTFKPNAKKKYFHRQYYAFLDKARELTGISIEAFCAETPYDIGMAMYKLNEAYQDTMMPSTSSSSLRKTRSMRSAQTGTERANSRRRSPKRWSW